MKKLILIMLACVALLAIGCGDSSPVNEDISMLSALNDLSAESSGGDVISATTNLSDMDKIIAPELDPFEGAAFIKPPQINNYGTVTLSYPIEVPPGRAGMQPGLGLVYSSSGGDGLAGIGWSLSTGMGVISRMTKNGQLHYDYRDTFTYNGQRLVKVDGPAYSENGTYRMEIESGFSRFVLADSESGGVWRVIDTRGTITTFGETVTSRIYHPDDKTRTFSWNFSKSVDLNGNFMTADYDYSDYSTAHVPYLKEIRYTGNENEGMPALQFIRFEYEGREEAYLSGAPGFIMKMDRLLERVIVGWGDPRGFAETELWSYRLVYGRSGDSGRPLLQTVDTERESTRPEFIYQPAEHSFAWALVENARYTDPEECPGSTKYFEGDFNGDGISDMVFFNPKTGDWRAMEGNRNGGYNEKYYARRFQGFEGEGAIQWFRGNATGDYNGDGRSDIAFYLPQTKELWAAVNTGTQFEFRCYGTLYADIDLFKCEWFSGDFDGNGLSDTVLFDEPTGAWYLMYSTDGRFEFVKFSEHFKNLFRGDYIPDIRLDSPMTADTSESGKDRGKISLQSGDYNGDGRSDISVYDGRSGRWWVGENYRDRAIGFRLEWKLYRAFDQNEKMLFAPGNDSLAGNDRFSGDFNGDGLSDFMLFHRDRGEWILGETGDKTITFRVFSRTPEFCDITRWLQGDFNGDGRTDIGFYSQKDGNMWVGETATDGFRFRVYNNCAGMPETERVLARAPLPRDEVVLRNKKAVVTVTDATFVLDYQYDANFHTGHGELAFTGHFSRTDCPELLFYKRKEKRLYIKPPAGSPVPVYDIDLNTDEIRIPGEKKAERFRGGLDGILYYKKNSSFISDTHEFNLIQYSSSGFKRITVAHFDDATVTDFDIDKSIYLTGAFISGRTDKQVLILDDKADVPRFMLCDENSGAVTNTSLAVSGDLGAEYFSALRDRRGRYCFFAGAFTGNAFSVLLVDMTGGTHAWYQGVISGGRISFSRMSGNPVFCGTGLPDTYLVLPGSMLYAAKRDGDMEFYRLMLGANTITQVPYGPLGKGIMFRGECDHENNPVVYDGSEVKKILFGTVCRLEALNYESIRINRADLVTAVYPFQWLQGDYNGDGKTDIGFFRMKERRWYYALTGGTVPDLMQYAINGIGGTYKFTYDNSTRFDNNDPEGIPRLPMNYKVCTSLMVEDGRGGNVRTDYEYSAGYIFSAYINGQKETDYFGFGRLTQRNGAGQRTVKEYHNVPYDDFRMNRALGGAIKTTVLYGSDMVEYERTEHEYLVHTIKETEAQAPSFLVEPVRSIKHYTDVLVETRESNIELVSGRYEMKAKSARVTDHYYDGAHQPVTLTSHTSYVNISDTNECRVEFTRMLEGTDHETTTSYQYDGRGNVIMETVRYTGTGLPAVSDRIIEYAYDGFGNRIRTANTSGSPGRVTEKNYDGLLHQFAVEDRSYGDSIVLKTCREINYSTRFGGLERLTDPNGNSMYFEYDTRGRLVRERITTDNGVETLQEYEFSCAFPLSVKIIQHGGFPGQSSGDGGAVATRVFADGMGRVIHSVRSATDGPGKRYVKTGMRVYDAAGRLIRQSQPSWANDDEIDIFRPNRTEKYPTVTSYDPAGRVGVLIFPQGYGGEAETSLSYAYNGPWETIETHSVGRSKRTIKNARGHALYIEDYGTGDDGRTVNAMIGFAYDAAGNRVKKINIQPGEGISQSLSEVPAHLFQPGIKDTSGLNVACWRYNAFGQMTESSDPDLGYARLEYNSFGDVAIRTDASGRSTVFTYDRLGRCIEKLLPGDEGVVRYTYDALPGSENVIGRMSAIDDPSQRKEFSYDAMGRVKRERRKMKGVAGEPVFEAYVAYDLFSRKRTITYPEDPRTTTRMVVSYGYCAMGPISLKVDGGTFARDIIEDIQYNEFGQVTEMRRGNGTVTGYGYDIKGRMESMRTTSVHNGQMWKVQDLRYQFKVDNSIAAVENTPDVDADGMAFTTVRYEYGYDGLNRLVHAKGDYVKQSLLPGETLPVDPPLPGQGGDIVKKFELSYDYSPDGNLISKTVYDPESSALSDKWSYAYENHAVRSITTMKDGPRFTMAYDAGGNMLARSDTIQGMAMQMAYDSSNRIRQVTDRNSGVVKGTYWYDDQGFRVRKKANFESDGMEKEIEILNPSMYISLEVLGKPSGGGGEGFGLCVNNIYLNGVRVASAAPDGEVHYYLTDQVDSVTAVVDDHGLVLTSHEYLPFGESWVTGGDAGNAPKYNSQELDKESGYYFYNARHYDPEIGRFVTPDSIVPREESTQGWNRFAYCANNPVVYRDPTGHVEIVKEQARVGDIMMRKEAGVQKADSVVGAVYAKSAAEVSNRIISQTDCHLGHSAIVKQAFKYNNQVVGVWVNDIVGNKIVDRLITNVGSSEWDPVNEKWKKIDKSETIDQYKFFRVGTEAEGEKAVAKLEKAMHDDSMRYDKKALFAGVGGIWSIITHSKNWKRDLGKFKDGDNKMVCTELVAWTYAADGKNGKLGEVFLSLPDQIFENQKMYDINGQLIPGIDFYKRDQVLNEYNRDRK